MEDNLHFMSDHAISDLAKITRNVSRKIRFMWILSVISFSLYSERDLQTHKKKKKKKKRRKKLIKKKNQVFKLHKCDLKGFNCFTRNREMFLEILFREMSELFC